MTGFKSTAAGIIAWLLFVGTGALADEFARHVIEPSSLFPLGDSTHWPQLVIEDSLNKVAILRNGDLEIRDLETRELLGTVWSVEEERKQAEYHWLKPEPSRNSWSLQRAPLTQGLVLIGTNGDRALLLLFDSSAWDCKSTGPVRKWSLPRIYERCVQSAESTLVVWGIGDRMTGKIIRLDIVTGERQDVKIPFRIVECWNLGEQGLGICSAAIPHTHQLGILANDADKLSNQTYWTNVPTHALISRTRPFAALSVFPSRPAHSIVPITAVDVHIGPASQRVKLPFLGNRIESAVWSSNGRWVAMDCKSHVHGDPRSSQSMVVLDTETWSTVQFSRPRRLYRSGKKNEAPSAEGLAAISNDGRFVFCHECLDEDLSRPDVVYEFAFESEY